LVWVIGVDPVKVTRFDPVGEPFAVKGRQVRPSAGADDQGEPPGKKSLRVKTCKLYLSGFYHKKEIFSQRLCGNAA
jgi:hypothetical protein